MSLRNLTFVAVFAILFAAAPASAQTRTSVAVLGFTTVDGDDATAQYLSERLRQLGGGIEGWYMRTEQNGTLAQMELAYNCVVTDLPCLQSIATALQVGSLIFGSIQRVMSVDGPDFVLEVALYDDAEMRIMARITERVPLHGSVETLNTLATRVIEGLARRPLGQTGAVEDIGLMDAMADLLEPPTADTPSSPGASPLPWVGALHLVGAALSLGVAIYSGVRLGELNGDDRFLQYRRSFPMGDNACDLASAETGDSVLAAHARSVCSDASTFETLWGVSFVTTIVLAAVGGICFGVDAATSHEAPVTIRPSVTPTSASITLAWRM